MRIRYAFCLVLALLLSRLTTAQVFPVDTLIKNGPPSQRINIVFLSDGYQAAQLPQFVNDARTMANYLFTQSPFREYRSYFNVFAVRVPSVDAGAGHARTAPDCTTMPAATVNNYFGSAFDQNNIHRLVVATRRTAVASVLAGSFPLYDQAFVLVNSTEYGGAGSTAYATFSINSSARETCAHEIGHSFANLADEYYPGAGYMRERANLTAQSDPTLARWAPWMNTGGVGLYPHAEDPTWKRPHQNCKMRYLGVPYCPVCTETIIERIHTLASPLQDFSPANAAIVDPTAAVPFALTLLAPTPNTLRVTWRRDGNLLARNTSQVTVPAAQLNTGTHVVRAEVIDTTAFSRAASHLTLHAYVQEWTVTNTATGTRAQAASFEYQLAAFPNPVTDKLTLSYKLGRVAPVSVTLFDAAGRRVRTVVQEAAAAPGTHEWQFTAAELGLRRPGTYQLVLDMDGTRISRQLIKE